MSFSQMWIISGRWCMFVNGTFRPPDEGGLFMCNHGHRVRLPVPIPCTSLPSPLHFSITFPVESSRRLNFGTLLKGSSYRVPPDVDSVSVIHRNSLGRLSCTFFFERPIFESRSFGRTTTSVTHVGPLLYLF